MCCGWWKQERTEQEIPWPRFWLMSKINKYQSCLCFKCSPPRPSSPLQVFLRNCMISRTNPLLCASTVFCHSLATAHPYHSFRITFSSWLSTLSTVSLYPRPWRPPSKVSSQCCLLLNESFPCLVLVSQFLSPSHFLYILSWTGLTGLLAYGPPSRVWGNGYFTARGGRACLPLTETVVRSSIHRSMRSSQPVCFCDRILPVLPALYLIMLSSLKPSRLHSNELLFWLP